MIKVRKLNIVANIITMIFGGQNLKVEKRIVAKIHKLYIEIISKAPSWDLNVKSKTLVGQYINIKSFVSLKVVLLD